MTRWETSGRSIPGQKLVRDRIPEILEARGITARVRRAPDNEIPDLLLAKLDEEVAEHRAATGDGAALDELADIAEVVRALAGVHGASAGELEARRAAKVAQRGGFDAGVALLRVDPVPLAQEPDA